jgi:hypothetical protein
MTSRTSRVLVGLLPEKYRDEIAGDLIEQSVSTKTMNAELGTAVVRLSR